MPPTSRKRPITLPSRTLELQADVDVLVVGGGVAGVAAAVSARRQGARVMLAERLGFFGGTMTAVTLGSICGEYSVLNGKAERVTGGIGTEIVTRLEEADGARGPIYWLETATTAYDPFILRVVLDDLVVSSGVMPLLHASVRDCVVEDGRITVVIFQGREGPLAVSARQVIDCTGDADLAVLAGAACETDLAVQQYPSAMFRFGGVEPSALDGLDRPTLRARLEEAVCHGHDLPRTAGGLFSLRPGLVHCNITRVADGDHSPDTLHSASLTRAEIEGRRQIVTYLEAFRQHVPGFQNAFVADAGFQLGVRESRRLVGRYQLTVDDVLGAGRCEDAIACSAWPVEYHGADRKTRWVWLEPGAYYQIPLRCLIPREGASNLCVAGRCASAQHDAHASMRVGATCMAMGEAAGVLATLVLEGDGDLAHVPATDVRTVLAAAGAFLG